MWRSVVLLGSCVWSGLILASGFDGRTEFNVNVKLDSKWQVSHRSYFNNPTRHYVLSYQYSPQWQLQTRRLRPTGKGPQQQWFRLSHSGLKYKALNVKAMFEYRDREANANNVRFRPRIILQETINKHLQVFSATDVHFFKPDGERQWDYAFARNRSGIKWALDKHRSTRIYMNTRWLGVFETADQAFLSADYNYRF